MLVDNTPSPPCPPLPLGYALPTILPHPDAVESTASCHPRVRRGAAPPRFYCFRFGLAAKPPNQTENNFFAGAGGPRAPNLWVMYSPLGEGGDGASWRHTRRVCRQDAPSGFPRPVPGQGPGGGVIHATNLSVHCTVQLVILKPCLNQNTWYIAVYMPIIHPIRRPTRDNRLYGVWAICELPVLLMVVLTMYA